MVVTFAIALAASVLALSLAGMVLARDPRLPANRLFAGGMLLLCAESACAALSGYATTPAEVARWQSWLLILTGPMPVVWLLFSLTYARGNYREFLVRWRAALAFFLGAGLVLALGFGDDLPNGAPRLDALGNWSVELAWAGKALEGLTIIGTVLCLMNLERTFRAAVGTMRWQIKLMVLGLGTLFVGRIYTSSQALLYSYLHSSLQTINMGVLVVAGLLILLSLLRTGLFSIDIYPSHAVLHSSLTVFVAGIYLVLVGVLAKIVTWLGGDVAFPMKAFLILVSLVGLTMLLLSDRIRQRSQRFVSRHFRRPHYDYRKVWTTFTEKTASLMDEAALSRMVAQWVSDTFNLLSVTLWLYDADRRQLVFGASTLLDPSATRTLPQPEAGFGGMVESMLRHAHPVDLDESGESWAVTLRQWNPDYFGKGGHRVGVPLAAGDQLLGVMAVGDRVSGLAFTVEDLDLLKCIGDQVGSHLLKIRLSHQLLQAKEMEAFQTMSAFFVHDLKNTAATLSLMLQNLPAHFEDPSFRQDALRGLAKSVSRMNDLIGRFNLLRQGLKLQPVESDLNDVVSTAMAGLSALPGGAGTSVAKALSPMPKLRLDPEQIQKVVTNLLLNAIEAVNKGGEVRVSTGAEDGWGVITVSDNGCGMSPEFVNRSLFRPFQTTKIKGIGIGMFHSKMIVDAHRGRIEVASQLGQGTTFRVLLPLS
jgi:putative PEP-CTERM system histidine kinase